VTYPQSSRVISYTLTKANDHLDRGTGPGRHALRHHGGRGPIDADVFEAFCRRVLAPTLKPGDLVVMDNLSSHKTAKVRHAIEETGAKAECLDRSLFGTNISENFQHHTARSRWVIVARSL